MQERAEQIVTQFLERSVRAWESPEHLAGLFVFQGIYRLSIWPKDGEAGPLSWEQIQAIKSACGYGKVDAVEVYPRDLDVVNTANARHVYLMEQPLYFAMRNKPPVLGKHNPPVKGESNGTS